MKNLIWMFILSISSFKNIITSILPFLLIMMKMCFGVKSYYHTDKITINYMMNHINKGYAYQFNDRNEPIGWVIGSDFICYITGYEHDNEIYVTCREEVHERITKPIVKEPLIFCETTTVDDFHEIHVLFRTGTYEWFQYKSRSMDFQKEMKPNQTFITDEIVRVYNEKSSCSAYIYGEVGVGKTMTAYLLASRLNGKVCDTFNPSEPNDFLDNVYSKSNATQHSPLILLMDEIDIMIEQVHRGEKMTHKKYPIQIHNKTTWNLFFDKLSMGLYPYVIIVMCSNVMPTDIRKMDPCYLRENRIDLVMNMSQIN